MTSPTCPKCKGMMFLLSPEDNGKEIRCSCAIEKHLAIKLGGMLNSYKPYRSKKLQEHLEKKEDIILIGPSSATHPHIAGFLRGAPNRFRFKLVPIVDLIGIQVWDDKPSSDTGVSVWEAYDYLINVHWLIMIVDKPDYDKAGDIAYYIHQKRIAKNLPTWFLTPNRMDYMIQSLPKSTYFLRSILKLPQYKLDLPTDSPVLLNTAHIPKMNSLEPEIVGHNPQETGGVQNSTALQDETVRKSLPIFLPKQQKDV